MIVKRDTLTPLISLANSDGILLGGKIAEALYLVKKILKKTALMVAQTSSRIMRICLSAFLLSAF